MVTEPRLSEKVMAEIQAMATAESKTPDEVVEDALRVYQERQGWQRLVRYGTTRAQELGLKESDVNRLIAESRAEQNNER